VLRARFDRIDGTMATVMIGPTRITVPSEPLAGLNASVLVDVFVRPEQLRMTTDHAAFEGSVAAAIFQGDHVDLYVDAPHAASSKACEMTANPALFQEKRDNFRDRFTVQHGTRDRVRTGCECGLVDAFPALPLA